MTDAGKVLEDAARTFADRNRVYSNNYERIGKTLAAMFPNGLTLNTAAEWSRMYFFMLLVAKMSRYATNWQTGHHDSVHDMIVYAALLEAFDTNLNVKEK